MADQPNPLRRVKGGFPTKADGRVHGTFTHNPSSLRLSMVDPNLQNIPRGTESENEKWVKECFVAPEGKSFWARDFSGIEAVLVGYFAGCSRYIRLAKLGVHAFLASHLLNRPADLGWSDADLRAYFKELKGDKANKPIYDRSKRTIHASNYLVSPRKLVYEFPETFPTTKEAQALQEFYFDLFPEIRAWHKDICLRIDGTRKKEVEDVSSIDPWTLGVAHAVNPFGYTHRFYNVIDWEWIDVSGETPFWSWSYGEDAKRLISFLPQSTAAAIIKQSAKELWYDYPWVGETMRLLIHDEIFGECSDAQIEQCLALSEQVMERPRRELPLDPAWGMGEFLSIGTEAKVGKSWGAM